MSAEQPQPNKYILYDSPLNLSSEQRTVDVSKETLMQQLEAGGFFMTKKEATNQGLLDPYTDENQTELLHVQNFVSLTPEEARRFGII